MRLAPRFFVTSGRLHRRAVKALSYYKLSIYMYNLNTINQYIILLHRSTTALFFGPSHIGLICIQTHTFLLKSHKSTFPAYAVMQQHIHNQLYEHSSFSSGSMEDATQLIYFRTPSPTKLPQTKQYRTHPFTSAN